MSGLAAGPWRWPWLILRTLAVLYVVLGVLVWFFQRRLIYQPDSRPVREPLQGAPPGLRTVEVTTADGVTLEVWHCPGDGRGTVLILHGNAGNRSHRLLLVNDLAARGWGVLLPDYRGYGGSAGSPSEAGLYADATACRAWLDEHVGEPVAYLGSSIGSGVAVELARRAPPAALILLSPFTSLVDVARDLLWFFPVGPVMRDRYDNAQKIDAIACPQLFVHGDRDRIVPTALGRELFQRAHQPKQWLEVRGAGHNDLFEVGGERLRTTLDAFLAAALRPAPGR